MVPEGFDLTCPSCKSKKYRMETEERRYVFTCLHCGHQWEELTQHEYWRTQSRKGVLCGLYTCSIPPTEHCDVCGNWYCEHHWKKHHHGPKRGYRGRIVA